VNGISGLCGNTRLGYSAIPTATVGSGGKVTWSLYSTTMCSGTPVSTTKVTPWTTCTSFFSLSGTIYYAYVEPFVRLAAPSYHMLSVWFYDGTACEAIAMYDSGYMIADGMTCVAYNLGFSRKNPMMARLTNGLYAWTAYSHTNLGCSGSTYLSSSSNALGTCYYISDSLGYKVAYRAELADDIMALRYKTASMLMTFFSAAGCSGTPSTTFTSQSSVCGTRILPSSSSSMGYVAWYDTLSGTAQWRGFTTSTACSPSFADLYFTGLTLGECNSFSSGGRTYYYTLDATDPNAPAVTASPTVTATATSTGTSTSTATATATATPTPTSSTTATATWSAGALPSASPSTLPYPYVLPYFSFEGTTVSLWTDSACSTTRRDYFFTDVSSSCGVATALGFSAYPEASVGAGGRVTWSLYSGTRCNGQPFGTKVTLWATCTPFVTLSGTTYYAFARPVRTLSSNSYHDVAIEFFKGKECLSSSLYEAETFKADFRTCSFVDLSSWPFSSSYPILASYSSGLVKWYSYQDGVGCGYGSAYLSSPWTPLGTCSYVTDSSGYNIAYRSTIADDIDLVRYPKSTMEMRVYTSSTCSGTPSEVFSVQSGDCSFHTFPLASSAVGFLAWYNALDGTVLWRLHTSMTSCTSGSYTDYKELVPGKCYDFRSNGITYTYKLFARDLYAAIPSMTATPVPTPTSTATSTARVLSASPTPYRYVSATPSPSPQSLAKATLTFYGFPTDNSLSVWQSFYSTVRSGIAQVLGVPSASVILMNTRSAGTRSLIAAAVEAGSDSSQDPVLGVDRGDAAQPAALAFPVPIEGRTRRVLSGTGVTVDIEVRAPPTVAATFQAIVSAALTNPSSSGAIAFNSMVDSLSFLVGSAVTVDTAAISSSLKVLTPADQAAAANGGIASATSSSSDSPKTFVIIGAAVGGAVVVAIIAGIAWWAVSSKKAARLVAEEAARAAQEPTIVSAVTFASKVGTGGGGGDPTTSTVIVGVNPMLAARGI
jgi:hypothetical protein